jgi:thiol-disulfide isomerase/thioredoxin
MGKASRTKVEVNRREKIAAQRAAAKRTEQRRRILIAGGSVLAVIIIIVAFIVIKANSSPSKPATTTSSANGPTGSALASVVGKVTSVPASTLNTVGIGGGAVSATPMTIKGNPAALTSGGKPEMLYMGAEYCPYCAAERWSMIVALSRFGTFSGLATVHSGIKNGAGEAEPYPSTPTWTFVNANYTSKYLTFTPVEMQTNIPDPSNGSYTNLQTPTAAQDALINKYDVAPYTSETGAIPFIDFGNKYLIIGASYNPGVLSGLSWSTIATDLHNPSSPVAQAVNGTANYITAAICKMTGNQPASACTSVVQSLESKI